MDNRTTGRVNFMLRLPPTLANEIRELAQHRGVSANSCAALLLRHAINQAKGNQSLNDRLSLMGVR